MFSTKSLLAAVAASVLIGTVNAQAVNYTGTGVFRKPSTNSVLMQPTSQPRLLSKYRLWLSSLQWPLRRGHSQQPSRRRRMLRRQCDVYR
jgi:hypothetical protein